MSCFLVLAAALAPLPELGTSWKGRLESQVEWVCWPRRDIGRFQAGQDGLASILVRAQEGEPRFFRRLRRKRMPVRIYFVQGFSFFTQDPLAMA